MLLTLLCKSIKNKKSLADEVVMVSMLKLSIGLLLVILLSLLFRPRKYMRFGNSIAVLSDVTK